MIIVPYNDTDLYEPLSGYEYGNIPDLPLSGHFFNRLDFYLNKGKIKVDMSCCFNFKQNLNIFIN